MRRFLFAIATVACATPTGAAGASTADEAQEPAVDAAQADPYVEEVVVTARQPNLGEIPRLEYLTAIYSARSKGADLYRRGRYAEAFPHLLVAAKRGFKFAQARVGFLYQQGLGVDQDPHAAIGWLGIAAQGTTMPEIRNHFRDLWAKIPEQYHEELLAVIDSYGEKYGGKAHRVGCDRSPKAGTHIVRLTCRFLDEQIYTENDAAMEELTAFDVGTVGAAP